MLHMACSLLLLMSVCAANCALLEILCADFTVACNSRLVLLQAAAGVIFPLYVMWNQQYHVVTSVNQINLSSGTGQTQVSIEKPGLQKPKLQKPWLLKLKLNQQQHASMMKSKVSCGRWLGFRFSYLHMNRLTLLSWFVNDANLKEKKIANFFLAKII